MVIQIKFGNIISLDQLKMNREFLLYKKREIIETKPLPYFKVDGKTIK